MKRILLLLALAYSAFGQIAADTSADLGQFAPTGQATTGTYAVAGPNGAIVVLVTTNAASAPTVGITWGASTLTRSCLASNPNGVTSELWVGLGVTSGTNPFIITSNGSSTFHVLAASYKGVSSSLDGACVTNLTNLGNAPVTTNYTTAVNNDWLVLVGNSVFCYSALSGNLVSRTCANTGSTLGSINDTNGPITPAGAQALQTTVNSQGNSYANAIGVIALSPSTASGTMTASPGTVPINNPANIVVSLTGTSTSWGGPTVFTISGVNGVTLVSQNVTSTTAATITITTGPNAGTLTISETVTGAASTNLAIGFPASGSCSTVAGVGLMAMAKVPFQQSTGSTLGVLVSGVCKPIGTGVTLSGTPLAWSGTSWTGGQGITGNETVANCTY